MMQFAKMEMKDLHTFPAQECNNSACVECNQCAADTEVWMCIISSEVDYAQEKRENTIFLECKTIHLTLPHIEVFK